MESVILSSPLAMLLFAAALFGNLFDRHYRASNGLLTVLSAVLCIGALCYAIFIGTPLWECATVLLGFLLVNLGVKE